VGRQTILPGSIACGYGRDANKVLADSSPEGDRVLCADHSKLALEVNIKGHYQ
jgi:hypothetical protein